MRASWAPVHTAYVKGLLRSFYGESVTCNVNQNFKLKVTLAVKLRDVDVALKFFNNLDLMEKHLLCI